jgi:uncharacterized protein (TIGR02466 family)
MRQENWFCSPVWYEYLNFDTQAVADKCLELRENNYSNRVLSNRGGWQSTDITLRDFEEFEIIDDLLKSKIKVLSKFIDDDLTLRLDNIWININERGDYNGKHYHPSSAFSGTIYIQVDENTGRIRFYDDSSPMKHYPLKLSDSSKVFNQIVTYTPKNGMLILFPSWMPHDVEESSSDMTRISISFNLKQVK